MSLASIETWQYSKWLVARKYDHKNNLSNYYVVVFYGEKTTNSTIRLAHAHRTTRLAHRSSLTSKLLLTIIFVSQK